MLPSTDSDRVPRIKRLVILQRPTYVWGVPQLIQLAGSPELNYHLQTENRAARSASVVKCKNISIQQSTARHPFGNIGDSKFK